MRKATLCFALAGLLGLGGNAIAEMCTIDDVPAATLLLPYFEVDCSDNAGLTTLFSINNASAASTLAHVTVWSNLSVPIVDFDVYLTGYDVQSFNLRDMLCNGELPVTGAAVSNRGDFSDPNFAFPECNNGTTPGEAPVYQVPAITGGFLAHIQALLQGQPSPLTGDCASTPTDNLVGYITVDDTQECSLLFPADDAYWTSGIPTNHNQLFGDWFMVDPTENFAQGDTLVHIEAEDGFTGVTLEDAEPYTFYARYTNDIGFIDNREPTATNFAVRHIVGGPFSGGTDLLVWRDSTSAAASRFTCPATTGRPSWYPLESKQVVIFDEEENPVTVAGPPVSGIPDFELPEPFPAETQRVDVGTSATAGLTVPAGWEFGWMYLNLNHLGNDNPWRGDMAAQAWVSAIYSAEGRYSVGLDAVQLDSACAPVQVTLTHPAHPSQQGGPTDD